MNLFGRSAARVVRRGALGLAVALLAGRAAAAATAPETPAAVDTSVKVTLFASEPDIVTPIGATVDTKGRLLVIESNSHFRPKNYQGAATDRIRILEDTKGSGKADKITTFYEGQNFLMNLAADRDGSIVVSSRNEIFRLVPDEKGVAGKKITLAHLETKADYPHNGLHGLAIGPGGVIYIGLGENLGGAYTLVGADGRKFSDDTGSGSIFRIDAEGHGLIRVAQGFWNPFGLGVDPAGNVWAVDNDPDGRPPCRLIDVVPGGDFGYEFRYGRTGMHPLQAWDAELPGTLGMVAGVGEAPCAVRWFRGRLYVSSWRDHQVESYTLTPRGASYTAAIAPIVRGGDSFRPVGLAPAPDGSLFVTDWGSKSYPVHGLGRVWKLTFAGAATDNAGPPINDARKHAAQLRQSTDVTELLAALDSTDPATAQAAEYGLSKLPAAEKVAWSGLRTPQQKIWLLEALLLRGSDLTADADQALKDPDDRVRQMGVRCVAERNLKSERPELDHLLKSQTLSPRLLGMTVATINQLDGDPAAKVDSAKINSVLLSRMNAPDATDAARASALHTMQASHPQIPLDKVKSLLDSPLAALQLEAVRYLDADANPDRLPVLLEVASDARRDPAVRAEAVLGLAADPKANLDALLHLAEGDEPSVRAEAFRALRPVGPTLTPAQREALEKVAQKDAGDADLVGRVVGNATQPRPPESDEAAWQKIVAAAPGNADAGRRIFFNPSGPGCYRCHMLEGRGRAIGPDLTMIGHSQTREHVLESILDPSREIAPLYTLWTITTTKGDPVTGMLLRRDGQSNEVYVDATGTETHVSEPTVIDRRMRPESLMPTGLVQALTDQELRDLLAVLMEKR